jgi:hypothetical protein
VSEVFYPSAHLDARSELSVFVRHASVKPQAASFIIILISGAYLGSRTRP